MQLLYGTYNPAKLSSMRGSLNPFGISLIGLADLQTPPVDVAETGDTPLENARIKAAAYRAATGMTTLAADSGLYLQGVPEDMQPSVHIRRIQDRRMSDEEMIAHYAQLAASMGGRILARYQNALCIAFADGGIAERFDDSLASRPFYLVDKPHPQRTEGFPLDSLSVDIHTGDYFFLQKPAQPDEAYVLADGYAAFVCEALGIAR